MSNHCKGFWSSEMGLSEWTPEDKEEVAARTAELRAQKIARELAAYEAAEPTVEIRVVPFREYYRHGHQPGSFS